MGNPSQKSRYQPVFEEAASAQLNKTPDEQRTIYIKSDLKTLAVQLQPRYPHRKILPWSRQPECEEPQAHAPTICGRADYLSIDSVVFPLWRTAIVNLSAANSGTQLVLIKIGGKWRVVSSQGFVI